MCLDYPLELRCMQVQSGGESDNIIRPTCVLPEIIFGRMFDEQILGPEDVQIRIDVED